MFEMVTVWYVYGMSGPEERWLKKDEAEAAARKRFPDDMPGKLYSRVWCKTYMREKD